MSYMKQLLDEPLVNCSSCNIIISYNEYNINYKMCKNCNKILTDEEEYSHFLQWYINLEQININLMKKEHSL